MKKSQIDLMKAGSPNGKIIIGTKEIEDPLTGIDIDKEYELIQNKKSTLSSFTRKLVVIRKSALSKEK